MDNTTNTTGGAGGAGDPREELREQLQLMGKAAGDLLEQLVRVPATLAQIPMQALPGETAQHARNAANEGFAAVRTLLDSMSRGIDDLMRQQRERTAASGGASAGVSDPMAESGASARDVESGATTRLDGNGTGSGSDSGGGNTIRLDEEP
jgi:hypothetical protein